MAAKIKKGDKVVVSTGKDKGKQGEVHPRVPEGRTARWCAASTSCAATEADREPGRRHLLKEADPPVEPRAAPTPRTASRPASASRSMADGKKVRVAKRSGPG
jgi:large subunit ribosomal protein L24